jgi:hypothetical protein
MTGWRRAHRGLCQSETRPSQRYCTQRAPAPRNPRVDRAELHASAAARADTPVSATSLPVRARARPRGVGLPSPDSVHEMHWYAQFVMQIQSKAIQAEFYDVDTPVLQFGTSSRAAHQKSTEP